MVIARQFQKQFIPTWFPSLTTSLILIQIKFYIDINNDELLETIWEHMKRKKELVNYHW
jgi:hypothetical protein